MGFGLYVAVPVGVAALTQGIGLLVVDPVYRSVVTMPGAMVLLLGLVLITRAQRPPRLHPRCSGSPRATVHRRPTAVLDHLFRVAAEPAIALGDEPVRYYEFAAADEAAPPTTVDAELVGPGGVLHSTPLLPKEPIGAAGNRAHRVIRLVLEDVSTSSTAGLRGRRLHALRHSCSARTTRLTRARCVLADESIRPGREDAGRRAGARPARRRHRLADLHRSGLLDRLGSGPRERTYSLSIAHVPPADRPTLAAFGWAIVAGFTAALLGEAIRRSGWS